MFWHRPNLLQPKVWHAKMNGVNHTAGETERAAWDWGGNRMHACVKPNEYGGPPPTKYVSVNESG